MRKQGFITKRRSAACLLALTIFAGSLSGCWWNKDKQQTSSAQGGASSSQGAAISRPDGGYIPNIPDVSSQLKAAKSENSDVVGWLQIPDTTVNEAVVQSTDNDYYYRRNLQKSWSYSGSLWMDHESTIGSGKPSELSKNSIIYGHNLGKPQGVKDDPDGVKFGQLFKFDDIDFAKNHPYFYFTTESSTLVYEVFTVFYSEDRLSPVPYHYADYSDADYEKLLADVRDRSQFDYNVNVTTKDKIMTLSTCTYKYGTYSQNPNQRFVVMGRLVRENESFYEKADVKTNPDPKAPQFQ